MKNVPCLDIVGEVDVRDISLLLIKANVLGAVFVVGHGEEKSRRREKDTKEGRPGSKSEVGKNAWRLTLSRTSMRSTPDPKQIGVDCICDPESSASEILSTCIICPGSSLTSHPPEAGNDE